MTEARKIYNDVISAIPVEHQKDIQDFLEVGEDIMATDFIKLSFRKTGNKIPEAQRDFIETWQRRVFK